MSGPKRFWKDVAIAEAPEGFTVTLDARPIKTPTKQAFFAPSRALAVAVAEEWDAQGETLDPKAMPQTRYVNSVIDGIIPNRTAVIETVAAYGGTDLLCYRAAHPDGLVARQSHRWDPLLDWSRDHFDAALVQVQGVMFEAQPPQSLVRLSDAVAGHDAFELAALHDLVAISGSLVLGLAVSAGHIPPEEAFSISRLDEDWQIEQWGEDDEASAVSAKKRNEFAAAARLLMLLREEP